MSNVEPAPRLSVFVPSSDNYPKPLVNGLKMLFDPTIPDAERPGSGTIVTDLANLTEDECCGLYGDGFGTAIFLDVVVRITVSVPLTVD